MPLSFDNFPGVGGGNALVLARDAHPIEATGAAIVRATMVPAFVPVPGAANNFFFQFAFIYWLLLPIIGVDPAFPHNAIFVTMTVHVNRLDVAFECCVTNGLDVSP
eukprot:6577364-Prymnesium_polylepis.1